MKKVCILLALLILCPLCIAAGPIAKITPYIANVDSQMQPQVKFTPLLSAHQVANGYAVKETAIPPTIPAPEVDYLLMSREELYSHLINDNVANDWWSLSYNDRRQLGLNIIQWWSVDLEPILFQARSLKDGDFPWWNPYDLDWHSLTSRNYIEVDGYRMTLIGIEQKIAIRYAIFTDNSEAPENYYYYGYNKETGAHQWFPWHPEHCFSLSTLVALSGEWMNALQIGEDLQDLSNYILFSSDFEEILPGHEWLGDWIYGTHEPFPVHISRVTGWTTSATLASERIATFEPPDYTSK